MRRAHDALRNDEAELLKPNDAFNLELVSDLRARLKKRDPRIKIVE